MSCEQNTSINENTNTSTNEKQNASTNDKYHIINVGFPNMDTKTHIYNKHNYNISSMLYENVDEHEVPLVYNFVYKYVKQLPKNKTVITMSPDPAISSATIASIAEKYMTIEEEGNIAKYNSNLKVLYFTSTPHLRPFDDINVKSLSNSVILNLMCKNDFTYTRHNLALKSDQFILIGLNKDLMNENDKESANSHNISNYTLEIIRKKTIKRIIESINEIIDDDPVHIVFDMSVMNSDSAPCVTRFLEQADMNKRIDGLNIAELEEIMSRINKTNIVGLDITGYDLRLNDNEKIHRMTCEVGKIVLKHLLNIVEKKINIFNENSKFLIWRPIDQVSVDDIGWFILRNVSLEMREQLLKQLDGNIITITLENDDGIPVDVLISSTSIHEQELKLYYTAESTYDCTLFPEEKIYMVFELLNTSQNELLQDNKNASVNSEENAPNNDFEAYEFIAEKYNEMYCGSDDESCDENDNVNNNDGDGDIIID